MNLRVPCFCLSLIPLSLIKRGASVERPVLAFKHTGHSFPPTLPFSCPVYLDV